MKSWLIQNKHVWLMIAHKDFEMTQTKYPVIFNYVPADVKVESPEFTKDISKQKSYSDQRDSLGSMAYQPNNKPRRSTV
ncbi:hypothetical protein CROQUDRAFT_708817 [Cronartium quercuum f. sp. fusiforme G11]|uniref:Uncharacterized protein n=1 Tax=Cronartium quercuum f. sp. fusiforme G11 TaxID=708437 RepID=A0A9P6NJB8_9BASI|nr:hypothetical protein CROQUDRAFT_708817 [Cronartium quercuum f. sp. fusiforme G11]